MPDSSSKEREDVSAQDHNTDEDRLEQQLAANEKRSDESRWEWLNKPVWLWLLTTLSASIIGYCYTNYSACRTSATSDNEVIEKIVYELSGRHHIINDSFAAANTLDADKALDPSTAFVFPEFKGSPTVALAIQSERLLAKWEIPVPQSLLRPITGTVDGLNPGPGEAIANLAAHMRQLVRRMPLFVHNIADTADRETPINELLRAGFIIEEKAKDRASKGVISPSVCVRRTFWPF